ncbi:MAG: hypothetical protein WBE50_00875, partial [Methyloceanibacter sp.]
MVSGDQGHPLSLGGIALAQEVPAAPVKPNPVPSATISSPKLIDFFSAKTPYEFWLTCVILAAGLIFAYLAIGALRLPVVEDGADTVGLLGGEFAAKQPRANLVEKNVRLMFVTSVPPLGYQPWRLQ